MRINKLGEVFDLTKDFVDKKAKKQRKAEMRQSSAPSSEIAPRKRFRNNAVT